MVKGGWGSNKIKKVQILKLAPSFGTEIPKTKSETLSYPPNLNVLDPEGGYFVSRDIWTAPKMIFFGQSHLTKDIQMKLYFAIWYSIK